MKSFKLKRRQFGANNMFGFELVNVLKNQKMNVASNFDDSNFDYRR